MKIIILLSTLLFCSPLLSSQEFLTAKPGTAVQNITIRLMQKNDADALYKLGMKIFAQRYNFTTPEQLDGLKKRFEPQVTQEQADVYDLTSIALVAEQNGKLVGFLSAQFMAQQSDVYAKLFMVDPTLHQKGVAKALMKQLRAQTPVAKRVLCATNKINTKTQEFYESMGAKKTDDRSWAIYLYRNLNPADFIGYEFDAAALAKIDKRLAS